MSNLRVWFVVAVFVAIPAFAVGAQQEPHWFETYVIAKGWCGQNLHMLSLDMTMSKSRGGGILFGKHVLQWSDNDIATALRVYKACEAKGDEATINTCMRMGYGQRHCEQVNPPRPSRLAGFERALRNDIITARNIDAETKAQAAARTESEKAEAQSKSEQAEEEIRRAQEQSRERARRDKEAQEARNVRQEEEARRKLEQLREQTERDKEAAEDTRRLAEREQPKIAEAIRQAEEARRARQEAEERLAEIRGRSEAQQKQHQEELAKKRSVEREAELEERTSGYQRISVQTFLLDGGDLAAKAAKVSISGTYIREGNLSVLYADRHTAMMAARGLHQQPNVLLLTDDASREFRQVLLTCQSNPASARVGCPVTILGQATKCQLSNAFGGTRDESCVAVEKGWQ